MKYQKIFLAITISFMVLSGEALAANNSIPAFPGAEGFGAFSVGGRGGRVIKVTNLNNSGTGSLRAATTASGRRTVVFSVSGIIMLNSELLIDDPYLTIAGETSPGGILVAGHTTTINTHDVIIRHMRFRTGTHNSQAYGGSADPETLDSFKILGNTIPGGANDAYNVIIDHCSFSWGTDENFSISYNAHDITVQWSIISEGLANAGHPKGQHSKGLLVSGKFGGADNVSLHHNYFAHNLDRNPRVGGPDGGFADVKNNIAYNYPKGGGLVVGGNYRVNLIHNFLKRGPETLKKSNIVDISYWDGPPDSHNVIYIEGTVCPQLTIPYNNNWMIADGGGPTILNTAYQRLTPHPVGGIPVTTQTASPAMAESILAKVGATVPVRDSIDKRNVDSFFNGSDGIVNNVSYPSDYPIFTNPEPKLDTDNDGMPDEWEVAHGHNKDRDDSSQDINSNGYSNLEEYLHSLAGSTADNNGGSTGERPGQALWQ